MATLRDLVSVLRQRPGVRAALVCGADGVMIAADADPAVAVEPLAAHAPALATHARRMAEAGGFGAPAFHFVEAPDGDLCLLPAADGGWLVVLAAPPCDRAALVAELRRHLPAIAALA